MTTGSMQRKNTRPWLLVRHIQRRLGCSPRSRGHFRPLVSGRDFSFHKREGVVGCGEGSSPFSLLRQPFHGRGVCRQLHGHGLSLQCRGTRSPALNSIAQRILRWSELHHVRLAPQFIMESHNVLADSLSRLDQIQGSEWTLHVEVFLELRRQWPVMIDLFATSSNHRCSIYFLPFRDPQAMGTDTLLQSWDLSRPMRSLLGLWSHRSSTSSDHHLELCWLWLPRIGIRGLGFQICWT